MTLQFSQIVEARNKATAIRLQARAKEAKLLALILRLSSPQKQDLKARYAELCRELHIPEVETHDSRDLLPLSQSFDIPTFCRQAQLLFPKRFKLCDILPESTINLDKDTRHQDKKDVERDSLYVGDELIRGSEYGYNAIVDMIAKQVDLHTTSTAEVVRFARAVLHSATRTVSGGDAYEFLERHVRNMDLVFVAPTGSEPMRITMRHGVFQHTSTGDFDFGIVARAESCTIFSFYALEDVDRTQPLVQCNVTCVREFGLGTVATRIKNDDGKSGAAMQEYACDHGGGYLDVCSQVLFERKFQALFQQDDD